MGAKTPIWAPTLKVCIVSVISVSDKQKITSKL